MNFAKKLTSISIKKKFIVMGTAMGVIPVIVMAFISLQIASSEIQDEAFAKLEAVRDIKVDQIEDYFQSMIDDISVLGSTSELIKVFDEIRKYHVDMNTQPDGNYDISTTRYKNLWENSSPFFAKYLSTLDYTDMLLTCTAHGHIMYTYQKRSDLGLNIRTSEIKETHLASIWKKVKETEKVVIEDFDFYKPNGGKPTAFIGAPFYENKKLIGVIILQIPLDHIDEVMQQSKGLGETGETILVGHDHFLRSDSRLANESTILKTKDESEAAIKSLEGKIGITEYICNHKLEAFAAYSKLDIPGLHWALISNVHREEVMAGEGRIISSTFYTVTILAIIMGFIGLLVANYFTNPILKVVSLLKDVAKGDLTKTIKFDTGDEFTTLSDSINEFLKSFRLIIGNLKNTEETLYLASQQLTDASSNVALSVTEVSTEISTVASATEEMSSNISNMSATAEEMSINANNVSTSSTEMSDTTSSVAAAVEEMSMSIADVLKNSNESTNIANEAADMSGNATETMKVLGSAADEIGKVTEVIKRIAEQTNLLALNATIEAASAGEAGKGFAVVANEIKELANQSATAAEDIATKITSVQENTTNAITVIDSVSLIIEKLNNSSNIIRNSVEQQTEAVNSIATITSEAQAATENISTNIAEVAQGSADLSKNASESAEGANEVSRSVHIVDETTATISAATEEFNSSAVELATIAEELKNIIGQFKV